MPLIAPAARFRAVLAAIAICCAGMAVGEGPSPAGTLRSLYARPPHLWPPPALDEGVAFREFAPAALPAVAADDARAVLGERLFRDPALSRDGSVSCASCHAPDHGLTVPRPAAAGVGGVEGRRNPPALHTAAARMSLGWDGRHASPAEAALAPLVAADEMGNADLESVLARLRGDQTLRPAVAAAFGDDALSAGRLADALVAYMATLDTQTRFDRFMLGDHDALDDREIHGLHLFRTKARCANCHFGPLLTDERFHNLRISNFGEKRQDLGRFTVTGNPADAGAMRTPSLRHVAATAPYMHSGLFATLGGVVNLYDRGGGEVWARNAVEAAHPLYPHASALSPLIRPLRLGEAEKEALVAFLNSL